MLHHALRAAVIPDQDPNFENVTLLLPGDGTNGAQNNTFLDSSANSLTITNTGTPTQGSYSPFGNLWSNYFGGSNYLLTNTDQIVNFGTGDFTVELWVFFATTGTGVILDGRSSGVNAITIQVAATTGVVQFYNNNGTLRISGAGFNYFAWNHIAVTRSGTSTRLFCNGIQIGSTFTDSSSYVSGTNRPTIGAAGFALGGSPVTGYISNVRVVKGTAVYTSNFTPPTTPLTAISGTSLLTCQSNSFVDNSSNNFAITLTGTPSVQRFSPFKPAGAYNTNVIGGSGYFAGSDYLSFTGITFNGDFCAECWYYRTANPTNYSVLFGGSPSTGVNNHQFSVNNNGAVSLVLAGTVVISTVGTAAGLNAWNHIAFVRSGSNCAVFVNGVRQGTATSTNNTSICSRVGDIANLTGYRPIGYVSNSRIVIGSSVYDPTATTLTVPTAPLTAITNTSLLLNNINAGIFDNAMMNNFETVGTAQISTTQSKWGGSSIFLNGTGNHLLSEATARLFSPGSKDFTLEYWCYPTTVGGSTTRRHFSIDETSNALVVRESANIIRPFFRFGSTTIVNLDCSVNFTANVWQHIALVRNGNVFTLYKDGVSVGSITNSGTITLTTGTVNVSALSESYSGYIDDLRFTIGVARYTANFTPPLQPFPKQ